MSKQDIMFAINIPQESVVIPETIDGVRKEVINQIQKAGRSGGFLSSSGTPIAFGTPPENVKALIDAAKECRV